MKSILQELPQNTRMSSNENASTAETSSDGATNLMKAFGAIFETLAKDDQERESYRNLTNAMGEIINPKRTERTNLNKQSESVPVPQSEVASPVVPGTPKNTPDEREPINLLTTLGYLKPFRYKDAQNANTDENGVKVSEGTTKVTPVKPISMKKVYRAIENDDVDKLCDLITFDNEDCIDISEVFKWVLHKNGTANLLRVLLSNFPEKCDKEDMLRSHFKECCHWDYKSPLLKVFLENDWSKYQTKLWFEHSMAAHTILTEYYSHASVSFVQGLPPSQQKMYLEIIRPKLKK